VLKLIRDGHIFHPQTNLGSDEAAKRTKSCYMNVFSKGSAKAVMPNTQYVTTNAGKTGYVSVPNKSQKILEKAYKVQSKTLTRQDPLGLMTEPMRSLKGPLLTEMVQLHKQKNRKKHGFANRKLAQKETVSRHTRLKTQALAGRKFNHNNEDLFFSPIDEYIREHFPDAQQSEDEKDDERKSSDSRDSVPGLTGNSHILMERDFFEKKYELE